MDVAYLVRWKQATMPRQGSLHTVEGALFSARLLLRQRDKGECGCH